MIVPPLQQASDGKADGAKSDVWRSLWSVTAPAPPALGALDRSIDCEIAIVGGGVEGLALARELALKGRDVALFEADELGSGATGASAGVLAPQLVRQTPNGVHSTMGRETGSRYLRLLADAGKLTFDIIRDRMEAIDARAGGFLAPATGAAGRQKIKDLLDQWREIRPDLTLIEGAEIVRLTGSPAYSAALHDPTGGSLNPLAYCRMLGDDALAAGAGLFTRSPVSGLERDGEVWRFQIGRHAVQARKVMLCANGGNTHLHPNIQRSVLPLKVCQVATHPLSPAVRQKILPQAHSLTDLETEVFSIRYDRDGRLITAHPMGSDLVDRDRLNRVVNARLSAMLPAYEHAPLEYAWTGTAWLTSSLLPQLTAVDERLFAIQACNGRGIALAASIAKSVADWLVTEGQRPCGLPILKPRPIPGYLFARYVPGLLMKMALATQSIRKAFS